MWTRWLRAALPQIELVSTKTSSQLDKEAEKLAGARQEARRDAMAGGRPGPFYNYLRGDSRSTLDIPGIEAENEAGEKVWRADSASIAKGVAEIMQEKFDVKKQLSPDLATTVGGRTFLSDSATPEYKAVYKPIDSLRGRWECLLDPISREEWEILIRNGGSSSAPGPSGLSYKAIRAAPPWFSDGLRRLINVYISTRLVDDSFKAGLLYMIPKKSGAMTIANARPITLLEAPLKLMERALAARLWAGIRSQPGVLHPSQQGFTPDGGVEYALRLHSMIAEDARENKKPLVSTMLDIRAAFDSVAFETVELSLRRLAIPDEYIALMHAMVGNASRRVIFDSKGHLSDPYFLHRGVAQGSVLSPLYFVLAIDPLLWILHGAEGTDAYQLSGSGDGAAVPSISFADDAVLESSTFRGANKMVRIVARFLTLHCIRLNAAKTVAVANEHALLEEGGLIITVPTLHDDYVTITDVPCKVLAGDDEEHARYLGALFQANGGWEAQKKKTARTLAHLKWRCHAVGASYEETRWIVHTVLNASMAFPLKVANFTDDTVAEWDSILSELQLRKVGIGRHHGDGFLHTAMKHLGGGATRLTTVALENDAAEMFASLNKCTVSEGGHVSRSSIQVAYLSRLATVLEDEALRKRVDGGYIVWLDGPSYSRVKRKAKDNKALQALLKLAKEGLFIAVPPVQSPRRERLTPAEGGDRDAIMVYTDGSKRAVKNGEDGAERDGVGCAAIFYGLDDGQIAEARAHLAGRADFYLSTTEPERDASSGMIVCESTLRVELCIGKVGVDEPSNNRAEITAGAIATEIAGLLQVRISIKSDSMLFVTQAPGTRYLTSRRMQKRANCDCWFEFDHQVACGRAPSVDHVRAHTEGQDIDSRRNDDADEAAKSAAGRPAGAAARTASDGARSHVHAVCGVENRGGRSRRRARRRDPARPRALAASQSTAS